MADTVDTWFIDIMFVVFRSTIFKSKIIIILQILFIKKDLLKIGCKFLVCESGGIVFPHEFYQISLISAWGLPAIPEPLRAEARHCVHTQVDKYAHLGLIIPLQHLLHC